MYCPICRNDPRRYINCLIIIQKAYTWRFTRIRLQYFPLSSTLVPANYTENHRSLTYYSYFYLLQEWVREKNGDSWEVCSRREETWTQHFLLFFLLLGKHEIDLSIGWQNLKCKVYYQKKIHKNKPVNDIIKVLLVITKSLLSPFFSKMIHKL